MDAGADWAVFVGWALLAFVGAEDRPRGPPGAAGIDGSVFGVGSDGFSDGTFRALDGTMGGIEGGGGSFSSYISAIILERPTIAAG